MASPKKLHTAIVALILVAASLISFSFYFKSSEKTGFFKKIVLEAAVPLENAVNSALGSVDMAWKRYVLLVGLEEKNRELERTVASLTREVNILREMSLEGVRLRKLLNMKNDVEFPSVAARVVGRNRSSVFQTVLINKGTADGIEAGSPVVAAEGVAGRIIEVSWNVSKVLLLVDYNSNIDALVQRNRCQGVLQGAGSSGCELKYVQRSGDVQVGDVVISSGLDRVFPRGLLLGTVAEVEKKNAALFQRIKVYPTLDIAKLEEVLVLVRERGDAR
ncbi:MAG: rod shape-determining protein MreC [Deltaproteobacteria bacterium]|nr:rod shape-determining protein MreC [Deltaproteobacteria bacterium]